MGIFKKLCMTSMLGVMLTVPTYATVVTGSQSDVNLDLKYPLVYTDHAYANQHIYQVSQNYKVTYEDSQVVSILLTTYYYYAGAAHGMYNTRGLVYNKVTGQRIPLYNYIKIANAAQLDNGLRSHVLSYYTGNHTKSYIPSGWSVKYVTDNYCLRGKGNIDLVYQPYELGPYAAGNTYIGFTPKAIEYFNRMNS
ncbi:MAG: hypothetical protein E7J30_10100 [Veillonella parvula]|nr:hypothetical protein [Veillonella parvula]